ncbi:unnamed protein product [Prunus armeniaca]
MSLIPSFFGGRRTNVFDPFSLDIWDPFQDFPLISGGGEHADQLEGDAGGARVQGGPSGAEGGGESGG